MAKLFRFFIFAVVAALSGACVTAIFHIGIVPPTNSEISYADFLAITLTALALMITILGLFFAAAGVIGWTTLENKLRDHSVNYFKEKLGKDGDLRAEMEALIVDIAHNGIDNYKSKEGISDEPQNDVEDQAYDD